MYHLLRFITRAVAWLHLTVVGLLFFWATANVTITDFVLKTCWWKPAIAE